MLFPTEHAEYTTLYVATRTDHEGIWVMVEEARASSERRSWMQAVAAFDPEQTLHTVSLFSDKHEANAAVADMVRYYGVETIAGCVEVRQVSFNAVPAHYEVTEEQQVLFDRWIDSNKK
jgi:hypothetical protein